MVLENDPVNMNHWINQSINLYSPWK